MFGIGTGELLLLLVIALIVLGPERMPQLARDLGKAMNDLRKTSDELQREFLNADRKLDAEKLLDKATAASTAPALPPPDAPAATETPSAETAAQVGATQGEVATEASTTPTEPDETAFDREARLARERIDRSAQP